MTLTATPDEVAILDAVATNLVRDWSDLLAAGHSPAFVLGMIVDAQHYDPRIGAPMGRCWGRGCDTWTTADDYCSDGCRDTDASLLDEARTARLYDQGADVRTGAPQSYAEVGFPQRWIVGGAA